jgi:deazaflavin-dependent oxidoreductase (nitroreductase family)
MSENRMNDFNHALIDEFRSNGGRVTGTFANSPLLLLTSRGAKSGQTHTTPLVYTRDGDAYVILASKGGAPTNPAWYHNLRTNPDAEVEIGTERFPVRARVTGGEEHDRLFQNQAALMPNFAAYQRRTTRKIPVVVLNRAG